MALMKQILITLFLLTSVAYSGDKADKTITPVITVSTATIHNFGIFYFGFSFSGAVILNETHMFALTADFLPKGLVAVSETSTNGKESYWGGVISYHYQFTTRSKRLSLAPGIALGVASIPYYYGDVKYNVPYKDLQNRETIFSGGPAVRLALGQKKVGFFMDNRIMICNEERTHWVLALGTAIYL